MLVFEVPIFVQSSKNKRFYINMNNLYSKHHRIVYNAKQKFYDVVRGLNLYDKHQNKIQTPARIYYGYHPKTKQLYDIDNIRGGFDKFVLDALVNIGMIEDDNRKVMGNSLLIPRAPDPQNPRCTVIIEENINLSLEKDWPPKHLSSLYKTQ